MILERRLIVVVPLAAEHKPNFEHYFRGLLGGGNNFSSQLPVVSVGIGKSCCEFWFWKNSWK